MGHGRSRTREIITIFVLLVASIELFWVVTAGHADRKQSILSSSSSSSSSSSHQVSITENPKYDDLEGIVPGNFIIVLHDGVVLDTHFNNVLDGVSQITENPDEEMAIEAYQMGGFNGYAATLTGEALSVVKANPDVKFIEPDRVVTLPRSATRVHPREMMTQTNTFWGLSALSHKDGRGSTYVYDASAGSNTTAYIVSTGVLESHTDFDSRATLGYNAALGSTNADVLGLGTALAGLIAGKTHGIAKRAKIVGIKVLGDTGSGTTSGLLSGIAWALADASSKETLGASAMVLAYGPHMSPALALALEAAVAGGMTLVEGAGDLGLDSPAAAAKAAKAAKAAIIVGATSSSFTRASYSNSGPQIDLWAPGTGLLTTFNAGISATTTVSGTTFAAGYVTGLALYLMRHEFEGRAVPAMVKARMEELAGMRRRGVQTARGTTGKFIYNGSA